MTKPALLVGVLASTLALALACTGGDDGDTDASSTESGSETASDPETTGDACTPEGEFANCGSGGLDACMTDGPRQCVQDNINDPSIAVCGRPCADVCDCWAAPADGDAPVLCRELVVGDDGTCVLDCTNGETCPGGMSCNDSLGICVFSL